MTLFLMFWLLATAPNGHALSLLEKCCLWVRILSSNQPARANRLTDEQLQQLKHWSAAYERPQRRNAELLEEHALWEVRTLPIPILRKIFRGKHRLRTFQQIVDDLEKVGINTYRHPVFRTLLQQMRYNERFDFATFRQKLVRVQQPADLESRYENAELRHYLSREEQPGYKIEVRETSVRFPEGVEYPLAVRKEDGSLLVDIPVEHLLTTDIPKLERLEKISKRDVQDIETRGIWGVLVGDGRFMIHDQHRRSTLYSMSHEGKIRINIPRSADGNYYAKPYLYVIDYFQPGWMRHYLESLSIEQRKLLLQQASTDSPAIARQLYYQVLRLPPISQSK